MPLTEDAAKQLSLRAYHQVQLWRDKEKNPLEWGWKSTSTGLMPITTVQNPAPDALLRTISCKCKRGCRGAYSCRKSGLQCSIVCANCHQSCENTAKTDHVIEEEEVDAAEDNLPVNEMIEEDADILESSESNDESDKSNNNPCDSTFESEDFEMLAQPGPSTAELPTTLRISNRARLN